MYGGRRLERPIISMTWSLTGSGTTESSLCPDGLFAPSVLVTRRIADPLAGPLGLGTRSQPPLGDGISTHVTSLGHLS